MMLLVVVFWQVDELQALRQQLEEEVDIPQLQPLRDETRTAGAAAAGLKTAAGGQTG